jgi:hypothetical protein
MDSREAEVFATVHAAWNNLLVVRTEDEQIYTGPKNSDLELWKSASGAGNFFTISTGSLWVSEHDVIAPVVQSEPGGRVGTASGSGEFRCRPHLTTADLLSTVCSSIDQTDHILIEL